jgi:hypothetical protein
MQFRKHGASNVSQHLHFHKAKYLGLAILKGAHDICTHPLKEQHHENHIGFLNEHIAYHLSLLASRLSLNSVAELNIYQLCFF